MVELEYAFSDAGTVQNARCKSCGHRFYPQWAPAKPDDVRDAVEGIDHRVVCPSPRGAFTQLRRAQHV